MSCKIIARLSSAGIALLCAVTIDCSRLHVFQICRSQVYFRTSTMKKTRIGHCHRPQEKGKMENHRNHNIRCNLGTETGERKNPKYLKFGVMSRTFGSAVSTLVAILVDEMTIVLQRDVFISGRLVEWSLRSPRNPTTSLFCSGVQGSAVQWCSSLLYRLHPLLP